MEDDPGLKAFGPFPMDESQKENLCTIPEDDLGEPSLCKDMPVQSRSSRRSGRRNLRKSLAWNKAFFTEEGVLDLTELSMLSGSVIDSGQKLLSGIDGGGKSPLTEFNIGSGKPASRDRGGKSRGKGHPEHQIKTTGARELFSKSEARQCGDASEQMVSGVVPVAKSIPRNLPRAPAVNSHKRVANVIATNPTSKIPRFMPTKTHAASHSTPSFKVMLTAKSSKSKQSVAEANLLQSAASRSSSFSAKGSAHTSSFARSSTHDTDNHMVDRSTSVLKVVSDQSFSTKLERPLVCGSSSKVSYTFPQRVNHVSGEAAAPVHAQPTSLRMPSPTLGFFSRGKVSPSSSNQSQRNLEPSNTRIPLRKDTNVCDLKRPPKSNGQKSGTVMAAAHSSSEGVISRSIQALSVASCSDLSVATVDVCKASKTNLKMEPMNETCRSDCSLALELLQGSSHRKFNSDISKEVPSECSILLQTNDEPVVEELKQTKQSLKTIAPENACVADLLLRDTSRNEVPSSNFLSQISFQKKLEGSYLKQQAGGSELDNVIENPQVRDEEFSGLTATDSSLSSSEKQSKHCDLSSSKLDYSLVHQKTAATLMSGSRNISAEAQSTLSEEDPQDCRLQYDLMNEKKKSAPMLDKETIPGTSKPDVIEFKKHLNAVPFSDEWLAALETFGEDLLELKTGPVQNSPTEKAAPELGPWSPVRRRAQDIGPFDCTKYLKNDSASYIE